MTEIVKHFALILIRGFYLKFFHLINCTIESSRLENETSRVETNVPKLRHELHETSRVETKFSSDIWFDSPVLIFVIFFIFQMYKFK